MKANYSIIFLVRPAKMKKNGLCPLECKITMNWKRVYMYLSRDMKAEFWDSKKQRVTSKSPEQKELNDYLATVKAKIYEVEKALMKEGIPITAESIRDAFMNNLDFLKERSLLEVFAKHNEQSEAMRGKKGYSDTTLWVNKYTLRLLTEFIHTKLKRKDILLKELNIDFMKDFHIALLERMGQNSTTKHLKLLKKVVYLSIANRWLNYDPFMGYKMTRVEVNVEYLTASELEKIQNQALNLVRWIRARDMFIFACYTGLAFVDIINLQPDDIKVIDGIEWIRKERKKTGVMFSVPLLPEAKSILKKYAEKGEFIPKLDCSDVNKYVKDIAAICQIEKRLTFHVARHTFATTVTLSKKIPIEVVARMMGHKNTRMTQHYAKVVDTYILDSMKDLL